MLTSLEIENFKGIAARQRIDFAPLTLLFGANSAGKSTILQALLYLHELIERGSADVDRTELGGSILELGGFVRLVHRHDRQRAIVLRAEFATPGGLERFGRDLTEFPFPDLDDEVESAWLELTIQHRTAAAFHGAMVERAAIGVNGELEPLVWLETPGSLREGDPLYARINLGHPLVADAAANVAESWLSISVPEPEWHRGVDPGFPERGAVVGLDDLIGFTDGRALPLVALSRSRLSALPPPNEPLRVIPLGDDAPEKAATAQQVRTFLEMIVLGTTSQLASFLRDAQYIGPLRTIPPRGFLYERAGRITSWADGLTAWDLLLADRLTLVERTNAWLRRLGAGCQVVVQQLFDGSADAEELSDGHVDKTVRRLLLDTGAGSFVLPSEVGAGISQLIPVVVAAIEGRGGLTLVEQPEVHVHPAVQVGLGDLVMEAARREGQRRMILVETHSEHLLLRVMRRMRETHEGTVPEGVRPVSPADVSVVLVEKDGARSITRMMPLNERGELVKAWPGGFFEEGLREVL
ncbi:AAA family ATPase (plasmid) [Sorangium sp. So ce119]|uniref:AAA family ATPase n=1 Tax=Sorangium sp. So ce119 TaxID=3133279 RepID=UPI003F6438AE